MYEAKQSTTCARLTLLLCVRIHTFYMASNTKHPFNLTGIADCLTQPEHILVGVMMFASSHRYEGILQHGDEPPVQRYAQAIVNNTIF